MVTQGWINMNIPFSPPDISEVEINAVTEVLRSGWITTGPKVKELERRIAEYVGVNKCVCLNSQTVCAEIVLRILGIGPGDEVITTAYTYTASASVICHVGAKPILIDTAPDSFEMDYDKLEAAVTDKTKCIIPVDIGGVPCDYKRIFDIVERKRGIFKPSSDMQKAFGRIVIMADTAHAFGAKYHDISVGGVADFSAFSFHAVKNLTTAEGGALTWKAIPGYSDDDIYHTIQMYSLHGQSKDALAKTKVGSWEYDIIGTWYKCNMTDIMGAMGLAQLSRYSEMLKRRKDIVARYDAAFHPLGILTLPHLNSEHESSYHLYTTRIPGITVEQRNEIINKMGLKGIACNVHYKPLPLHTAYRELGFDIKDYPNAYNLYVNEITLPLHTKLTDEQVDYIIDSYKAIVSEYIL